MNTLSKVELLLHAEVNHALVSSQRVSDANVELAMPHAGQQAYVSGQLIGADFFRDSLLYCSPDARTRHTFQLALDAVGLDATALRIYQDPDLRDVDHGYEDIDKVEARARQRGYFSYRFDHGESPSDCYTRVGLFLQELHRRAKRKSARSAVVCTHGVTARCLVMRWFHLTPDQFDTLANPDCCDLITIGLASRLVDPQFVSGRWGVTGLRFQSR